MTMKQFFAILRARWLLALTIFGVVLGVLVSAASMMPRKYRASTQILVDVRAPDLATGQAANPGFLLGYMATQVDIVNSQSVALRVVDALKLVDPASTTDPAQLEILKQQTADALLKNLTVKPSRDSSVLDIAYTDSTPSGAATVANAIAQAYIDTTVRVRTDPAAKSREWFEAQSKELRTTLEEAQRKLAEYQRAKGITSADERLDVESARLNELSSQVTALQATTVDSGRRQQSARDSGSVAEVLQSPLIQTLKTEQARLEARLRERSAVLGPQHPEILRLTQELESVRGRIGQESATVTESLSRSHQVNVGRLRELESSLAAQRAKVLQLRQVRTELSMLQGDADRAQRAYDAVRERLSQTTLESRITGSNVSVISAAEAPLVPSSPNVPLIVAAGIVLGVLLATAAVMLIEAANRKVRGVQDLEMLEAPVLGTIRKTGKRRPRSAGGAGGLRSPRRRTGAEGSYGATG
jgi:succinoglycan biosynthesis transport protein ExoP